VNIKLDLPGRTDGAKAALVDQIPESIFANTKVFSSLIQVEEALPASVHLLEAGGHSLSDAVYEEITGT
jgi:hypothetical protein